MTHINALIKFCCLGTYLRLSCVSVELLRRVEWLVECAGRGGGPGVGLVARCYVRLVWRWPPGPDRWHPGPLPAGLCTLTRQVAAWAPCPRRHLKGPAVNRRASSATYGTQLCRRGGIATIGGSGRRVVGVSRAYGRNSPVWSRAAATYRTAMSRHSNAPTPRCADAPVGARAPHIVMVLKPCQHALRRACIVPVLERVSCCFIAE